MTVVQRFVSRASGAAALMLVLMGLQRPVVQSDSAALAAEQEVAAMDSALAARAAADSVARADSLALADSVRLVARLLVANGAPEPRAEPAAAAIMKYARRHELDPLLVVGIIGVENATLSPRARSGAGARGVMQVMPHWKKDIRDCGSDLHDVVVNVCFGTRILRIALDETSSVRQALLRYNGCVRSPTCHTYPAAVFSRSGQAVLLSRATRQPAQVVSGGPR